VWRAEQPSRLAPPCVAVRVRYLGLQALARCAVWHAKALPNLTDYLLAHLDLDSPAMCVLCGPAPCALHPASCPCAARRAPL
jgi:hypothetical protein